MFKDMIAEIRMETGIMVDSIKRRWKNREYFVVLFYSLLMVLNFVLIPLEMIVWYFKNM